MKRIFSHLFYFFLLLFFCADVNAKLIQHTKLWLQGVFIGPIFKNNEKWKYFLDGRLRLIDNQYSFEQARVYYGLGYQITDDFAPYMGGAYVVSKNLTGMISHENRLWQQILWDFFKKDAVSLSDRTRFEERKNLDFAQWAWRLREQITAKIPIKNWQNHSLKLYDEVFFNLNHPDWVSNHLISENRIYIGIETKFNKTTSIDMGYINQSQFDRAQLTQRSHIVTLTLNVKS